MDLNGRYLQFDLVYNNIVCVLDISVDSFKRFTIIVSFQLERKISIDGLKRKCILTYKHTHTHTQSPTYWQTHAHIVLLAVHRKLVS